MTIPDALIQASIGIGTSAIGRDQAEKHRLELENYRQELLSQLGSVEFRNKNQTDQRAELDLLVRLFRDYVTKRMTQRMQSEFQYSNGNGKSGGGLTQQISINNPLRNQSIKGALSQQHQQTFVLLTQEIAEQKKLLSQMKEETNLEKKQVTERMQVLERVRIVSERSSITCEQFAINAEKIERDSGFFIDTLNQQDILFDALREFSRKGKGIHQLEIISSQLKETSIHRCGQLVKQIESSAKNQSNFAEMHGRLPITENLNKVEECDMIVPKSPIERYNFYLACLRSLIESEKALGGEFARQS